MRRWPRRCAELPEIYRAPVVLRDIEGLTTEEASSRLKVKDQTLKSRLHRGRLMLREKLEVFRSGLGLHRPTPAIRNALHEFRPRRPFGQAGRKLQCECCDPLGSRRIDLFPVIGRTVIVRVEAGEEVDRRNAAIEEVGSRRCGRRRGLPA